MAGSKPKTPFFSIDVSYWTIIVWRLLNPWPSLVIVKASEYTEDPKFIEHCAGVRSIGASLGAYHFARPGDMGNQAKMFIDIIRKALFTAKEVLVFDFEDRRVTLRQMKQWLDHVERETGMRPIIYARKEMIDEKVNLEYGGIPPEWFNLYFWWFAGYPIPNANVFESIPAGYIAKGVRRERAIMWQYDDKGVLPGSVGNNNDLNWVSREWARLIGLPETKPGGLDMGFKYSIKPTSSAGSKVRKDHNTATTSIQVGSIPFTEYGFGDEDWIAPADVLGVCKKDDRWLKVLKVGTQTVVGWVAEIHLGARFATIETLDPTPPVDPPVDENEIEKIVVHYKDGTTVTVP